MSKRELNWVGFGLLVVAALFNEGCARPQLPQPPAGLPGLPQGGAQPAPGPAGAAPADTPSIPAGLPGNLGGLIPNIPAGLPPGTVPPGLIPPAAPPDRAADASFQPGQATVAGAIGQELDAAVTAYSGTLSAGAYCGSVMVAKGNQVLLDRGYGIADAATNQPMPHNALWDWASVGKQFTAAAILKARSQNRISLDDTIDRFYPNCPADKKPIKIRHLLSHSSGVDNLVIPNFLEQGRDPMVNAFLARAQKSPPGTVYEYSPMSSFNVAAACLEVATGGNFDDYMQTQVWGPAGLRDTQFMGNQRIDMRRVPKSERGTDVKFIANGFWTWAYRGSGGVVTTARELFVWDQALRGETVLNAEAKEQLYTVQINNYALGWQVGQGAEASYSHAGNNGVGTYRYKRLKDSGIVVAFAASHRDAGEAGALVDRLIEIAKKTATVP